MTPYANNPSSAPEGASVQQRRAFGAGHRVAETLNVLSTDVASLLESQRWQEHRIETVWAALDLCCPEWRAEDHKQRAVSLPYAEHNAIKALAAKGMQPTELIAWAVVRGSEVLWSFQPGAGVLGLGLEACRTSAQDMAVRIPDTAVRPVYLGAPNDLPNFDNVKAVQLLEGPELMR